MQMGGAMAHIGLEALSLQDNLVQNIHSDAVAVVEEAHFSISRLGMDSIRSGWEGWSAPMTDGLRRRKQSTFGSQML